ncbi:MAG: hypothetical protein QNJ62_06545 [Methyloceanibacter sp.]|nr:hypothetical protein [Methyloceanibacter sp.]
MLKLLEDKWIETETSPSIRVRIRGLTGAEIMAMRSTLVRRLGAEKVNQVERDGGSYENAPDAFSYILECGLLEWEPDNIQLGGEPCTDKARLIGALPLPYLVEIAKQIQALGKLEEEQEKNSESQSRSALNGAASTAEHASTGDTAMNATPLRSPGS